MAPWRLFLPLLSSLAVCSGATLLSRRRTQNLVPDPSENLRALMHATSLDDVSAPPGHEADAFEATVLLFRTFSQATARGTAPAVAVTEAVEAQREYVEQHFGKAAALAVAKARSAALLSDSAKFLATVRLGAAELSKASRQADREASEAYLNTYARERAAGTAADDASELAHEAARFILAARIGWVRANDLVRGHMELERRHPAAARASGELAVERYAEAARRKKADMEGAQVWFKTYSGDREQGVSEAGAVAHAVSDSFEFLSTKYGKALASEIVGAKLKQSQEAGL
mmetsp:Transcript_105053/g.338755  ORF Transcript_105053/g.338755 Transcript_105053/m.338755 type:complete len:289 (-) Transcript_105053:76-942(-)